MKKQIEPLNGALDIVNALSVKTYFFDRENHPSYNLVEEKQFGFISQEVQKIIPEAVHVTPAPSEFDKEGNILPHSGETFLGMNYNAIIPINSAAIKELNVKVDEANVLNDKLQKENEDLNTRLTELENCLSGILPYLCQMSQTAIEANTPAQQDAIRTELELTLSNKEGILLDQNVPNPFAEQTVINFSIPESVKRAQIHFYNVEGQLIQTAEITERGLGSIRVFGSDLSRGTYTYTLVADEINVATKKMLKN